MATAAHAASSLDELVRQSHSIPRATDLACCCGRQSCAYLSHNNAALDDLEKDIRQAAQLGQALLVRHEAYMAEAEQARLEMSTRIESLEMDKKHLETENAKAIQENRSLLNQLEDLNGSIADSDTQVKSLEATLQSTQQELRRLEGIAQRTHDLEVQLAALEQEQAVLQQTVTTSAEEERTAIQRWRKAERGLYEVQQQLEKIEREAREERERHVEVVGRMQRQRTVEKELESAAGRLKGAAAATSLGQGKNGSNVVSHFVKDILQDNANLQMGIVELRDMLMSSNDEVQTLREQLMLHQPVSEDFETGSGPPTLRAELAPQEAKEPQVISQELHIHHHYHTPVKKDEIRRPKKKRTVIHSGLFTPPSGMQSSRNLQMRPTPPSAAVAILSNTAITVPPPLTPTNNRWSIQSAQTASDFAPSSAPSSPRSTHHLFDRGFIDQAFDSRPTSPGSSLDPMSPIFKPNHRKRGSEHSTRSFTAPNAFRPAHVIHEEEDNDVEELTDFDDPPIDNSTVPDESETSFPSADSEEPTSAIDFFSSQAFQPTLRRSTSHESILSISGIDIHTLHSRPSQITITGSGAMLRSQTRSGYGSPSTSLISTEPIIGSSLTIAQPTLSRYGHSSSSYLRSSMGLPERPYSRGSGSTSSTRSTPGNGDGLSKKVGGWVWSRWGVAPTLTSTSKSILPSTTAAAPQTPLPLKISAPTRAVSTPIVPAVTVTVPPVDPLRAILGRSPGINQKGPVPGFRRPDKAPFKVTPERVDQDALSEVLME